MKDEMGAAAVVRPFFKKEAAEMFKMWKPTPSMHLIIKKIWAELEVPEHMRRMPETRWEAQKLITELTGKCQLQRQQRWNQIMENVKPSEEMKKEIDSLWEELNVHEDNRKMPESRDEARELIARMRREEEERRRRPYGG